MQFGITVVSFYIAVIWDLQFKDAWKARDELLEASYIL
jgi:hypothetical protein